MKRTACVVVALAAALGACEREQRNYNAPPSAAASGLQMGSLHVGPAAASAASDAASAASASASTAASAASAPLASAFAPASSPLTPVATSSRLGYEKNAVAVAEGKRLFRWYNCNGCHASGGGAIGPALMDDKWIYGSEPQQIVATILQGRPNGMPSFGGRIPEDQAWKIAAYVRSMSGQLREDVAPSRGDGLSSGAPELRRDKEQAKPSVPGKDH
jgi:cytochrome c oxidase cbb3-type subunit 3